MAYQCEDLDLLHDMLQVLNPTKIEEQGKGQNKKTIYRFEQEEVVLCVYSSTKNCQFQGKNAENSELSTQIITIIQDINKRYRR